MSSFSLSDNNYGNEFKKLHLYVYWKVEKISTNPEDIT